MKAKILIVDDEEKLRRAISAYMRAEGFEVYEASGGAQAMDVFHRTKLDLIVLDVMLPDISGFEVCRQIREQSDLPIVMLTTFSDDDNHILGYRVGADDYLSKPFKISILAIKVSRMLEKTVHKARYIHRFGKIHLDSLAHVCQVDGTDAALTSKEFDLLLIFMQNPGRVLTRTYLLESVWHYDYDKDIRVVDAMIKRLRKKLGSEASLIRTITGVGYKLEEQA